MRGRARPPAAAPLTAGKKPNEKKPAAAASPRSVVCIRTTSESRISERIPEGCAGRGAAAASIGTSRKCADGNRAPARSYGL